MLCFTWNIFYDYFGGIFMATKSRDERVKVKMLELSLLKAKEAKRKSIEKVKELTDTVRRAKSSISR